MADSLIYQTEKSIQEAGDKLDESTKSDINKAIETTITISRNEWKYYADMKTELDASLPMVECFIGDIKQVNRDNH